MGHVEGGRLEAVVRVCVVVFSQHPVVINISKRRAIWALAGICAAGAAFRFYNLAWGAPYYHFQIDEHFVLGPANVLRHDTRAAAMGSKFFMYGPVMMQLINVVR